MKSYLRSFAGGEISSELFGRLDLVKNQTGLARALNFLILPHGPAANRAGFEYVLQAKYRDKDAAVLPFIYDSTQSYALEFGDLYMRIHTEGGTVLEASQSITGISKASPGVVTKNAHGYSNGEWLFLDVTGMTELDSRFVIVAGAAANTFTMTDLFGNAIDTTSYGTFTSGTMARVYEISTPYLEADLPYLHFTQSNDVLTITHVDYQQRELRRLGATNWQLATLTFAPVIAAPTTPTATANPASGTPRTRYKFTSIAEDGLEESSASQPAVVSTTNITGITQANPGVITAVAHGRAVGDAVWITGIVGMTQLNNTEFLVNTVPSVDTLTFKTLAGVPVNTTAYTAWSSGGTVGLTDVINDLSVSGNRNTVTATPPADAVRMNVYKLRNGLYGYIGQFLEGSFVDDNITPDLTQTLPEGEDPFTSADNYPGGVGYFKGRRWFGGTENKPANLWGTRAGTEKNMTYSIPQRDDDRIAVRLTARQRNQILHIIPLEHLILLTSSAGWVITTQNSDSLTPTTIDYKAPDDIGASNVQPIVAGGVVLFEQAQGGHVREMTENEYVLGRYKSKDLSIMAPHLFDGYTLRSAAYTHAPYKIGWFVRSDGVLLGNTYVPEHEVKAWHWHVTAGDFKSVCSVPEGAENVLYSVVKRTTNGQTVRNIERMRSRQFNRLQDAFFVDCGTTFVNTIAATLTPGAGATVAGTEDVIFTAGSAIFAATDVDRYIHYDYEERDDDPDSETYGMTLYRRASALITAYTDTTHVKATIEEVWPSLTSIASSGWRLTVTTISGLWHNVGETVSVLGDGAVFPQTTVSAAAQITLEQPASVVQIGRPYNSDLQTLPIVLELAAFGVATQKNPNRLAVRAEKSSGLLAGPSFSKLREAKQRTDEPYGTPPNPTTGILRVAFSPSWGEDAPICIRQPNPLPLTIVALVPDTAYGS